LHIHKCLAPTVVTRSIGVEEEINAVDVEDMQAFGLAIEF
jgi:hypothetical protein